MHTLCLKIKELMFGLGSGDPPLCVDEKCYSFVEVVHLVEKPICKIEKRFPPYKPMDQLRASGWQHSERIGFSF